MQQSVDRGDVTPESLEDEPRLDAASPQPNWDDMADNRFSLREKDRQIDVECDLVGAQVDTPYAIQRIPLPVSSSLEELGDLLHRGSRITGAARELRLIGEEGDDGLSDHTLGLVGGKSPPRGLHAGSG